MSARRVVLLVVGSLVVFIGIGLMIGGGAILFVDRTYTDEAGFLTVDPIALHRDAFAITAPTTIEGDWLWWWRGPATIRVDARSADADRGIFIGVAAADAVAEYLSGTSYAEIRALRFDENPDRPFEYVDHIGTSAPAQPTLQPFWKASATGVGTQSMAWDLDPGDWVLVIMNADGSRVVDVAGSIGVKAPWLFNDGLTVLAIGVSVLALGLAIVLLVARRTRQAPTAETVPSPAQTEEGSFPIVFRALAGEPLSPALWLVKWLLLIPHYVVLAFLYVGFAASWFVSLFAILFTGRYPRSLFDYNVGVIRWTWRVGYYGYQALATDRYPPFTLRSGGYPADIEVPYPERLAPGLALVKWWLLAIPHYVVLSFFQGGAGRYYGGLVPILSLFAGVTLLFTGKYPESLRPLIVGMNRWTYRVLVYATLMTDAYPPFRLDD